MKFTNKINKIKYYRMNKLEKYFISITDELKKNNNYYTIKNEIIFELKKYNVYLNRYIYNEMYSHFTEIENINNEITFELYLISMFEKYLDINIKSVVGINSSTQDYWDEIIL